MIKVNQISFKRQQRTILTDVSFEVRPSEHWVILGRNGCGKTTILEMLNGYLFPSSGQIEVLGQLYGTVDVREVRQKIGYVSQSLMDKLALRDPVWEVVATGKFAYLRMYEHISDELRDKALEMLKLVRLEHLKDQPIGLCSQGERKKLMLARALMSNPEILIMDEPCSGLDLYERESFLADLERLKDRTTIVYVTHHMEEIVPVFTHVLLIGDGKVVAAGPKKKIMTPEFIRQAYQVDVEVSWHRDRPWIHVN